MTTSNPTYRYLKDESINPRIAISNFKFFTQQTLGDAIHAIRVKIPEKVKMEAIKDEGLVYYTTRSKRALKSMSYDVVIKINGKWTVKNELKGISPKSYKSELRKQKIYLTKTEAGYMTQEAYGKYLDELKDIQTKESEE